MANGDRDFRFRNQLNIAGTANLLANKRVKEEQIKASQQNRQTQQFGSLLQAVSLGSSLANSALTRSMAKQTQIAQAGLADALGALTNTQQRGGEQFLQKPIQQFDAGAQPTQAIQPTLGQTTAAPAALSQARRQAALVAPQQAASTVLGTPPPAAQAAPAAQGPLLSAFQTRKVLREAGFSVKEIRAGVSKNGTPLPKRIRKGAAGSLKPGAQFGNVPPPGGQAAPAPTGSNVADKFGF